MEAGVWVPAGWAPLYGAEEGNSHSFKQLCAGEWEGVLLGPGHSFNGLRRRYYPPHWADGETEAQKGDVTCPAGFVTEQEFLTLAIGVLPQCLCLPWR